jgi:hypothetical protein
VIVVVISGQRIVRLMTLKSQYDNDCVVAIDDSDNEFRIKVDEFLKLQKGFNDSSFRIVEKKVHKYLEVVL